MRNRKQQRPFVQSPQLAVTSGGVIARTPLEMAGDGL